MRKPILVGITGGSASGKSRLAGYLCKRLGKRAAVFCMDWYYRDHSDKSEAEAQKLNFDHPRAIETPLFLEHLRRLRRGEAVDAPTYRYSTHSRTGELRRIEPASVILIDGLFVLCDPRVRAQLDLAVYIDVPADERLVRRVRRDVAERGVGLEETLRLYEHCVRPMHLRFIGPSAKQADLVWKQMEDRGFKKRLFERISLALRK
ncbi:MAG: uridine kinase [Elusimicrobiota bacterium]|jgi:uridine kinase